MKPSDESSSGRDLPPVIGDPLPDSPFSPLAAIDAESIDDQPRLGIIHIMLWTLGSAIILAVTRNFYDWDKVTETDKLFRQIMQVFYSMYAGAGVGGLILFVARRIRGMRFPTQPGHWLLLVTGLGAILSIISLGIMLLFPDRDEVATGDFHRYHLSGIFQIAIRLLYVAIYLSGILLMKTAFHWKLLFSALICNSLCWLGFHVLIVAELWSFRFYWLVNLAYYASLVTMTVTAVILFIVALLDKLKTIQRGWLHWTGVAVTFSSALLQLSWLIWSWFFRS